MRQYMLDSIQAIVALTSLFVVVTILFLLVFSLLWLRRNCANLTGTFFLKTV